MIHVLRDWPTTAFKVVLSKICIGMNFHLTGNYNSTCQTVEPQRAQDYCMCCLKSLWRCKFGEVKGLIAKNHFD